MSTIAQAVPHNQPQITFWDDFDELNSLVRAIVYKVTRRHELGVITFQSHIDDLLQLGWQTLLEAQADDPTAPKGKIISRVAWAVQKHIWNQVFSLYRDDNRKTVSCLNFWKVAGAEHEEYDPGKLDAFYTVEYQPFGASTTSSPETLIADTEVDEPSADELIEQFTMRWSDRSFLFHRIPFDEVKPTDPELEHALFILLCATQTYCTPHSKLHPDTKRRRAYIMMRRLQGVDNVTIGQEIDLYRVNVGAHVQSARRTIDRWLKLSRNEQLAALQMLEMKYPAIESVSLAKCNRKDEVFDPHNIHRLARSADVLLRHVQSRFGISQVEWGDIYEELKQVALLHLVTNSAAGKPAKYAYRAAEREVHNFIYYQLWNKDPRWNRERDKHLALDVEHESWELFADGDDGQLVPEPMMGVSAEFQRIHTELAHDRDQHWQRVEAHLAEILFAMNTHFSAKLQQAAQSNAHVLTLRLRFGYTGQEIAWVTGIGRNTVKTMLRKAKQKVRAFLALSADAQAARLLKAAFAQEPLADIPQCQLRNTNRPIAVIIEGERCTLSYQHKRRKKGNFHEVYLNASQTVKTRSGNSRAASIYIGTADSVTVTDVRLAFGKLQMKYPQLFGEQVAFADLPVAGD